MMTTHFSAPTLQQSLRLLSTWMIGKRITWIRIDGASIWAHAKVTKVTPKKGRINNDRI